MIDIRTLQFTILNNGNQTRSFKLDFGNGGDAYWIFPDTGYKVSFHKSGQVHIKNNYDKGYYEEIDLSEEALLTSGANFGKFEEFQQILRGKSFTPEGKTVYAWNVPNFKNKTQEIMNKFCEIRGRHAIVSIDSPKLISTMVEASPVLYETTDIKLQDPSHDLQGSIAFDEEGRVFVVGENRMFDMTDLANISINSCMEILGPFGRILDLLGESVFDYDDEGEEDEKNESNCLVDQLEIRKL